MHESIRQHADTAVIKSKWSIVKIVETVKGVEDVEIVYHRGQPPSPHDFGAPRKSEIRNQLYP